MALPFSVISITGHLYFGNHHTESPRESGRTGIEWNTSTTSVY